MRIYVGLPRYLTIAFLASAKSLLPALMLYILFIQRKDSEVALM